jgi:chromosome partitioning protein
MIAHGVGAGNTIPGPAGHALGYNSARIRGRAGIEAGASLARRARKRLTASGLLVPAPEEARAMAKVVAVTNQKGGVGKTTTAVNLATSLALAGARTLLVDFDPQANATSGLGLTRAPGQQAMAFLVDEAAALPEPLTTEVPALDLVPTGPSLADLEPLIWRREDRFERLKRALARIRDRYEWLLIDCPPSLGLFPLNALAAADSVLVPIQCEFYAMEGLAQILETIRKVKKRFNPDLELEGILLTMHDPEVPLSLEVEREVRAFFKSQVYETVVPRDESLAEAASHGRPVLYYRPDSRATRAYVELAREILYRSRREG